MLKNYLITAFRNMGKNKLYTVINIFGLAVGLTACLLIGLYIRHELSYDKFNVNAGRIVRATMEYRQAETVNKVASTGTKAGPEFKRRFPQVEEYARTFISHNVVKAGEKMFDEPRILYADPAFFQIFSFPMIEGDPASALNAPNVIALSRSMAIKYFGKTNVINNTITSGGKDFRISAVFEDVPLNSQLKFDFATRFLNLGNGVQEETWWTANWITYFLLNDKSSIATLQQQVDQYMSSTGVRTEAGLEGNNYLRYNLEPITRVHLYSSLAGFEPNGSITYIYMFIGIALLILVIACANYTNLATAQSVRRSGEIGMRKVMGASGRMVFLQFIGESALITLMAALLAFLLGYLLVPYFNDITGIQFSGASLVQPVPILALLTFCVLVSFFAGLYPALVLSGTRVMGVLKKGFRFSGGNNLLRKSLIVVQFTISIFLIIYTVIMLQQVNYMRNKNLGYEKDHIVVLPIGGNMLKEFNSIKEGLQQVPGVESVTASYETPEFVEWGDGITAIDEKGKHEISLNAMPVDLDFCKTLGIQLVAGRDFQESDFALMDTAHDYVNYRQPYLINETLAKKIGWEPQQAIGRTIDSRAPGPLLGVIKDFNFSSLHNPVGPLIIFLGRNYSRNFMVRIKGGDMKGTIGRMARLWKMRIPDRPFDYHFLADDYNKLYEAEQRTASLFSVAAGLGIALALLGLFGLAAYTTVQRTKEIGIRRVLGAGAGSITLLVSSQFLKLVAISILLAVPLVWWSAHAWLQDFAYRISIQFYVFVLASMATLLIALGTVGFHSMKAALRNPVKSLRTE